MAFLGKKPSSAKSTKELQTVYQNLDKPQSRSFYHEILEFLKDSIVEGDIEEFRKYVELLELINKLEKTTCNLSFFTEGSPFEKTNVLILACQYERPEHLTLILSNYCNVLYFKSTQQTISPLDEDEHGKNAYYYLIRTSNIELLEQLIDKWPEPIEKDQLDMALSKSYSKLVIQNVELSDDMKFFIEYTLCKLRLSQSILGNICEPQESLEQIKERSLLITSTIENLIDTYGEESSSQIGEKFVYSLKFLIMNLNVLKRILRCTYNRLPWEEIEFGLIIFIKNLKSTTKTNFYYKSYIKRENLLKYLKEFGIHLQNVIDSFEEGDLSNDYVKMDRETVIRQISARSPMFKDLYETHSKIREFHTIETIIDHLSCALESDELKDGASNSFERDLIIQKCVLLLWESMKTSLTSPNSSIYLSNMLWTRFGEDLQNMFTDIESILEDQLGVSLGSKIRKNSKNQSTSIECSLREIHIILKDLHTNLQFQRIIEIIDECLEKSDLQKFENFIEIFDFDNFSVTDYSERKLKFYKIMIEIEKELYGKMDSKLEFLLDELTELMSYGEHLSKARFMVLELFSVFAGSADSFPGTISKMLEKLRVMFQPRFISNTANITSRIDYIGSSYETKIMININQILHHISAKGYENSRGIIKLKSLLPLFWAVKPENQKLVMRDEHEDSVKLFKKRVRKSNCLQQILKDKIEKLKMILDRCGLVDDYKSLKYFITFKGRTETFIKVEMLLFDILTILQDDLLPNANIYDLPIPLLMGAEMRNYLKWGCTRNLADLLGCNVKLCVLVQCIMLTDQASVFPIGSVKQLPTIREVQSNWNHNIGLIDKKIAFFKSFECDKRCDRYENGEVDLLSRDFDGLTAVHIAVRNGDLQFLKNCLVASTKENSLLKDRNNQLQQNILHIAAQFCSFEDVKVILKKVADTNIFLSQLDINWRIPLHYAASHATAQTVLKLLECYPEGIFVADKTGWRPIHMAIKSSNIPAFKILLDAEKDINNSLGPGDSSLLHIAAEVKSEEITKLLIDRGPDVNLISKNEKNPLHVACTTGSYNIVKMLVHKGSDINARDAKKAAPLCRAVVTGNLEIVKFLLANNAGHIETKLPTLHSAILGGSVQVIDEILKTGVSINIKDTGTEGGTPLHVAVNFKKLEAAKHLKHGANVNLKNNEGIKPLSRAIMQDDYEMVKLLLPYYSISDVAKADVPPLMIEANMIHSKFSSHDIASLTSVHLALLLGNIDVLKLMVQKGVALYKIGNWEMAVRSESIETVQIVFDTCHSNYIRKNMRKLNDVLYIALRMNSGAIAKYLVNLGAAIDHPYDGLTFKLLHYAILNFDSELVKYIIEKHIRQNKRDGSFKILEECWNLIVHSEGAVELAQLFIKYGNIKTRRNLLRNSTYSNNLELIAILIEAGLSIDLESVFCAMRNGNTMVAKMLLEHSKFEINSKDSSKVTLLHVAAKHCDSHFIEYLLSKGSEVNSLTGNGYLPIEYAAMSGKHRSVDILLRNGSKLGRSMRIAIKEDNARLLSVFIENNCNVDKIDTDGSALHLAIYEKSENCSYLLLESGKIDVNCVDNKKWTPLHVAASLDNVLLTKILLAMNADDQKLDENDFKPVNLAIRYGQLKTLTFYVEKNCDALKETLLHDVARTSHAELVHYLVCKNFDVNKKDDNGDTPLHIAARSSTWKVCRTLIENGAYYNTQHQDGMSPGGVASTQTKEHFVLLQRLFDMAEKRRDVSKISNFFESHHDEVSLNAKAKDGRSLLHIAVAQENVEMVQNLLKYNANVNITDLELNTPLHYAAKSNNLRIVKSLLSAGAKYKIKNIQNMSPYNLSNNSKIKHLLLIIDKCFRFVADKNLEVCRIVKDIKNFEERKMIIFGARNEQNQSIYSYIVIHDLTDMEKAIGLILNQSEALELNKAFKLRLARRFQEAFTLLETIISKLESLYGRSNPFVLNVLTEYTNTLYDMEQYDECFEKNKDLIKRSVEVYGEDSEIVEKHRQFSAFVLSFLDENKKVISILEKTSIKKLKLNTDVTESSFIENCTLSETLSNIGWYDEALAINTDVFGTCLKKLNKNDLLNIEILTKRAQIFSKQKNFSEAHNLFYFTYMKYKERFNQTHLYTLSALEELSQTLINMGRLDQAISKIETLYELSKRSNGACHPVTLEMNRRLIYLYLDKEDYETVRKIFLEIKPALLKSTQNDVEQQALLDVLQSLDPIKILESSMRNSAKKEQKSQIWRYGALFREIKNGRIEKVSEILQIDDSLINGVDKNGVTPLHLAVNVNNTGMLALLMESGADIFALTKNGNTILHTAANQCNSMATKTIIDHIKHKFEERLQQFVNRQTVRGGKTALHVAAEKDSHEICLYLLQNGAVYNILTKDNKNPKDLAKDYKIKKLFSTIDTVFNYTETVQDNLLHVLKEIPEDELNACKHCRNIKNKTLLECVTSNKNFEILNSTRDFLNNGKKN